jgi:hypothetical protein
MPSTKTKSKQITVKRRKYAPRRKVTKRIKIRSLKIVKKLSAKPRAKRV